MAQSCKRRTVFCLAVFLLMWLNCVLTAELDPNSGTQEKLDDKIKASDKLLLLFYDNDCKDEKCQEAKQAMKTIWQADYPNLDLDVVESEAHAKQYGFKVLPQVVFYRKSVPILYHSAAFNADDMYQFVSTHSDVLSRQLTDDNFEHDTQAASGATTGDWMILFYKPTCSGQFPAWEAAASRLQQRLVFGHVDTESSPAVEARFNTNECPTVMYFRHGKSYLYEAEDWSVNALVEFAEAGYQKSEGVPVPSEASSMDGVSVLGALQGVMDKLLGGYCKFILAGCGALVLIIIIAITRLAAKKPRRSHFD